MAHSTYLTVFDENENGRRKPFLPHIATALVAIVGLTVLLAGSGVNFAGLRAIVAQTQARPVVGNSRNIPPVRPHTTFNQGLVPDVSAGRDSPGVPSASGSVLAASLSASNTDYREFERVSEASSATADSTLLWLAVPVGIVVAAVGVAMRGVRPTPERMALMSIAGQSPEADRSFAGRSREGVRCLVTTPHGAVSYPSADELKELLTAGRRPRLELPWPAIKSEFQKNFGVSADKYDDVSKEDLLKGYYMMQLCRQFETQCNIEYMQGNIRGFMHLDNGQEGIPAMVHDFIKQGDKKISYYREHTHALASGVEAGPIMAELFGKDGGTCRGTGGSMHIFDKELNFQGGWALVAEQLPYATGAARSILLDRFLDEEKYKDDDRLSIVFVGEGGALNGRMAECMNAAAKEKLPILFVIIDNGRAINTFSPDVAANNHTWQSGAHYGVPGIHLDGQNLPDLLRAGRAVSNYVRTEGPAIMQVHTFRFSGHSPADPEHERGRKDEKRWARSEADPLAIFEEWAVNNGITKEEMEAIEKKVEGEIEAAVDFAKESPPPPASLAAALEFPESVEMDYNNKPAPENAEVINERVLPRAIRNEADDLVAKLTEKAQSGDINIGDALNLAILEEMIRDPYTCMHAEDLQAGSSYGIPNFTQRYFGKLRAADEIIDEGHFIGKALGEGLNGYRPIIELMNTNFGIYAIAEISSAGNTYATTGGQFDMPMTIVGAGGTAPNQSLGAEHSQPFHAYIMGIPGIKICTASSPAHAYGLLKSMIRDNGPGVLLCPVKMMKFVKGKCDVGKCLPLSKCELLHKASDKSVADGKAVTILTYLHGVYEVQQVIPEIQKMGIDVDVIELLALKPLDIETIRTSLERTHKIIILDESTESGGVGATISAAIGEKCFDLLDAPVQRLAMTDAPVPYASSMEVAVVKRGADVISALTNLFLYMHPTYHGPKSD